MIALQLILLMNHFRILKSVKQNFTAELYSFSNYYSLAKIIHLAENMPVQDKIADRKYVSAVDNKNVNCRKT